MQRVAEELLIFSGQQFFGDTKVDQLLADAVGSALTLEKEGDEGGVDFQSTGDIGVAELVIGQPRAKCSVSADFREIQFQHDEAPISRRRRGCIFFAGKIAFCL